MGGVTARLALVAAAIVAAVAPPAPVAAQQGAPNGEWPYYGGDLGGTKYSGLDQIDATNFDDLQIAWRWQSADAGLDLDAIREIHEDLSLVNLKVTPLMVGGVLYVVTPLRLAVALDAGTGETIWVHNPEVIGTPRFPSTRATSARAAAPTGGTATTSSSTTARPTATCWRSTPGPVSRSRVSVMAGASIWQRNCRATDAAWWTGGDTRSSA